MTEKKSYNLASLSKEEMDKVNVDLVASGVAYKERMNQPVIAEQVEREQPEHLRDYFRERVAHYREVSKRLPTGSAPVYLQMADANGKK
ncbi:DNA polymerase III subunit theta [Serratia sp. IR-2025]